ncbi:DUF5996 family protein [Galbitalea sp. SE-J8]|uniref:DUF5996 family protein n=1 Tax=Galbitalea sp. SE-J8 TaxID=3054952 RepID=UPI00259C7CE2|nr:DUF5996 family protein [Galbitalea sp. SE-J8]MDM4761743.1 DUF5996 family protein [Galbitalea sp. SE-J8]
MPEPAERSTPAGGLPALPVAEWQPTRDTLHMWLQIVGKIKMAASPPLNHWWHTTLRLSARGLVTGAIPTAAGVLDIEFDFIDHSLVIRTSGGDRRDVALEGLSVAGFHRWVFSTLRELGLAISIHAYPNEVPVAIPFAADTLHRSYVPEHAQAFWRQLIDAQRLLQVFRSEFRGKASPVHFFWGAMDLAVTRFSGRPAPRHPGGIVNCPDRVMVEGYSDEISSAGFWPGGGTDGAFYSYAYPSPPGYADAAVPDAAFFSEEWGEFLLPVERVRAAPDPDGLVADFLHATHRAASSLGSWPALEPPEEQS